MKTIAITMGDPAGIGPEIIAAAWEPLRAVPDCRCVVYGHPEVMRRAAVLRKVHADIDCVLCCPDDVLEVPYGMIDARAGHAAYQSLLRAIEDAKAGLIDAVATAPIHKAALHQAGHHYPGHTEIFAEQCGVENYAMMLYLGAQGQGSACPPVSEPFLGQYGLAVVHVTLHTAMKTIFEQITFDSVLAKIRLAHGFMQQIMRTHSLPKEEKSAGIPQPPAAGSQPRIGVCALNPHAGEEGLFGDEEIRIIQPALKQALAEGLHVEGPKPADTLMLDARAGKYDAVVAMFHDQGHIALKLLGMYRAVNITLGLPIIRTSVAHGTAFDKAGQGIADPGSLIEAVRVAAQLLPRR